MRIAALLSALLPLALLVTSALGSEKPWSLVHAYKYWPTQWAYMWAPSVVALLAAFAFTHARTLFVSLSLTGLGGALVVFYGWASLFVPPTQTPIGFLFFFPVSALVIVLSASAAAIHASRRNSSDGTECVARGTSASRAPLARTPAREL